MDGHRRLTSKKHCSEIALITDIYFRRCQSLSIPSCIAANVDSSNILNSSVENETEIFNDDSRIWSKCVNSISAQDVSISSSSCVSLADKTKTHSACHSQVTGRSQLFDEKNTQPSTPIEEIEVDFRNRHHGHNSRRRNEKLVSDTDISTQSEKIRDYECRDDSDLIRLGKNSILCDDFSDFQNQLITRNDGFIMDDIDSHFGRKPSSSRGSKLRVQPDALEQNLSQGIGPESSRYKLRNSALLGLSVSGTILISKPQLTNEVTSTTQIESQFFRKYVHDQVVPTAARYGSAKRNI